MFAAVKLGISMANAAGAAMDRLLAAYVGSGC
jgi:hypothetical protein